MTGAQESLEGSLESVIVDHSQLDESTSFDASDTESATQKTISIDELALIRSAIDQVYIDSFQDILDDKRSRWSGSKNKKKVHDLIEKAVLRKLNESNTPDSNVPGNQLAGILSLARETYEKNHKVEGYDERHYRDLNPFTDGATMLVVPERLVSRAAQHIDNAVADFFVKNLEDIAGDNGLRIFSKRRMYQLLEKQLRAELPTDGSETFSKNDVRKMVHLAQGAYEELRPAGLHQQFKRDEVGFERDLKDTVSKRVQEYLAKIYAPFAEPAATAEASNPEDEKKINTEILPVIPQAAQANRPSGMSVPMFSTADVVMTCAATTGAAINSPPDVPGIPATAPDSSTAPGLCIAPPAIPPPIFPPASLSGVTAPPVPPATDAPGPAEGGEVDISLNDAGDEAPEEAVTVLSMAAAQQCITKGIVRLTDERLESIVKDSGLRMLSKGKAYRLIEDYVTSALPNKGEDLSAAELNKIVDVAIGAYETRIRPMRDSLADLKQSSALAGEIDQRLAGYFQQGLAPSARRSNPIRKLNEYYKRIEAHGPEKPTSRLVRALKWGAAIATASLALCVAGTAGLIVYTENPYIIRDARSALSNTATEIAGSLPSFSCDMADEETEHSAGNNPPATRQVPYHAQQQPVSELPETVSADSDIPADNGYRLPFDGASVVHFGFGSADPVSDEDFSRLREDVSAVSEFCAVSTGSPDVIAHVEGWASPDSRSDRRRFGGPRLNYDHVNIEASNGRAQGGALLVEDAALELGINLQAGGVGNGETFEGCTPDDMRHPSERCLGENRVAAVYLECAEGPIDGEAAASPQVTSVGSDATAPVQPAPFVSDSRSVEQGTVAGQHAPPRIDQSGLDEALARVRALWNSETTAPRVQPAVVPVVHQPEAPSPLDATSEEVLEVIPAYRAPAPIISMPPFITPTKAVQIRDELQRDMVQLERAQADEMLSRGVPEPDMLLVDNITVLAGRVRVVHDRLMDLRQRSIELAGAHSRYTTDPVERATLVGNDLGAGFDAIARSLGYHFVFSHYADQWEQMRRELGRSYDHESVRQLMDETRAHIREGQSLSGSMGLRVSRETGRLVEEAVVYRITQYLAETCSDDLCYLNYNCGTRAGQPDAGTLEEERADTACEEARNAVVMDASQCDGPDDEVSDEPAACADARTLARDSRDQAVYEQIEQAVDEGLGRAGEDVTEVARKAIIKHAAYAAIGQFGEGLTEESRNELIERAIREAGAHTIHNHDENTVTLNRQADLVDPDRHGSTEESVISASYSQGVDARPIVSINPPAVALEQAVLARPIFIIGPTIDATYGAYLNFRDSSARPAGSLDWTARCGEMDGQICLELARIRDRSPSALGRPYEEACAIVDPRRNRLHIPPFEAESRAV